MNKFVLIGGGKIGTANSLYETEIIDKEIVNLCDKENPNLLFIGLASSFSDAYFKGIKKIYSSLGCNVVYLKKSNIINNFNIVEEKFRLADIIYIAGGDTIKLLDSVKEYGIDKLLKNKDNCIIVGNSAGAILLSKFGYSDSLMMRNESDKYEFIEGLGLIDINICPHFNIDEKKKELYNELDNFVVYGINERGALYIFENVFKSIGDKVIKCYNDNKLIEEEI